jgi:hypothetical protein
VRSNYERPQIREIGSVRELTLATNKIGPTPDLLTVVNPDVVGSFTPFIN